MFAEYYEKTKQYGPRIKTDTFVSDGTFSYTGMEDWYAKLIEKIQLKDKKLWALVVNQFRGDVDDADKGWRSEYWGKLMRGAAITYRYTQDEELYQILEDSTRDLLTTQRADGRFSTYSEEAQFDGWDIWGRKYIILGILHFYEICKDESLKQEMLSAVMKHADYLLEKIGEGKHPITKTSTHWGSMNSCSVLEPMMRLYNETGEQRYLDFASYIVQAGACELFDLFETAFEDKMDPHEYPVVKAYEMMSCFEGLLEYYRVTGIEKYKEAVVRFVRRVADSDISVIGCSGIVHELFSNTTSMQTDTTYVGISQETCVTVTWMKLCTQLLWLTGDITYANYIETSVYNAFYGSVNTDGCTTNGGLPFDSYSPLLASNRGRATGGLKFMEHGTYYGCCAAIGAAGTGMIPGISVMESRKGVVFHLYCNGTAKVADKEFTIKTQMPAKGQTEIMILTEGVYEIKLRIPPYCSNAVVSVNGESVSCTINSYLSLEREWSKGDQISLQFDWDAALVYAKGFEKDPMSPYHVAITYGPLVLARDERLGEVGTPVSITNLQLKPSSKAPFQTMCEFELETEQGMITLVDYASAGKDWKSAMECWLPTKQYERIVPVLPSQYE